MDFALLRETQARAGVRGHLGYDSRDPYTVRVFFMQGDEDFVEWVFGRDLLAAGLQRAAGHGDIRIRPSSGDPSTTVIELAGPFGTAVLAASSEELASFLACSNEMVPIGREHLMVDWESELARLLAGEH